MIDKWHAEGSYIDTDMAWAVAAKEALENMDRYSLKRLLNTSYGLTPAYNAILTMMALQELQRRNKEEKKMEDNKYYSGSVAVTTWRSRKAFEDGYTTLNHRADLITFREGVCVNIVVDPNHNLSEKLPLDARKKYTKEEIEEFIMAAWDKGEYAADQTDINWIFNPDPEGFTGTVDLATVLLKDNSGEHMAVANAIMHPVVRARCRVRIVNGTFFEKLDGSSKLADILKQHKGVFATKEDIEKYIKDKWCISDFGNDASYYALEIKED